MVEPQEQFEGPFEGQDGDEQDPWSEDGWYFDLPAGAWERQEAKNRALRENVRANVKRDSLVRIQQNKKNPFTGRDPNGLASWLDDVEGRTPSGDPRAVWGSDEQWSPSDDDDEDLAFASGGDWTDEDVPDAGDEQAAAEWGFEPRASRPARPQPPAAPEPPANPAIARVEEALGMKTERPAQQPPSRWEEMFGAPAGGSIVDSMKEWAERGRAEREEERDLSRVDPELLQPFDWETDEKAAATPDLPPMAAPYVDSGHSRDEPPAAAQPEIVHSDDLAIQSWSEFAVPPGDKEEPQKKSGGLLSRVFGGRKDDELEGPEWAKSENGWQPQSVAPASAAGWVPADNLPPTDDWTEIEGRDDDTPLNFGPSEFLKEVSPAEPDAPLSMHRGWGPPPSEADGSLQYDLPRRFAGRNVWDDGWLESPALDDVEEPEPAAPSADEPEAAVESEPSTGTAPDVSTTANETSMVEGSPAEDVPGAHEQVAHLWNVDAPAAVPVIDTPEAAEEPQSASPAEAVAEVEVPRESVPTPPEPEFSEASDTQDAKPQESNPDQRADIPVAILHAEFGQTGAAMDVDGVRAHDGHEAAETAASPPGAEPVNSAHEDAQPPGDDPGDPWTAFLVARESGGSHPFGSPATGMPGAPVSWEKDQSPGEAPIALMSSREPESRSSEPEHDPWAEIVAASGYDDAVKPPIYTGRRDDTPPPRERLHSLDYLTPEPGPAARLPREPDPEPPPGDGPVPFGEPDEPPPHAPAEPWADEDDVVLRAFEEHARSEPSYPPRAAGRYIQQQADGINELLGEGAADLVEEAMASPVEGAFVPEDEAREPMPWDDPLAPRAAPPSYDDAEEGWPEPSLDDTDGAPGDDDAYYRRVAAGAFDAPLTPEEPVEATVLRSRRRRGRTVARELVETLLLALLVFLAVRASFQNFKVDGNSMYPTLDDGEFLIVNKLVYSEVDVEKLGRFLPFLDGGDNPERYVFHGPERGDIIVLRDPAQPGVDLIKRVVGLPGETIEIVNGTVFINGFMLEEPYIDEPWHYTGPRAVTMGPGEYFVMGDNRDNSKDSRAVGPVHKDLIIGKAMLTYWPAGDFGLAPNESPHLTDKSIEAYRAELATASASP